jgi:hypothetical protein
VGDIIFRHFDLSQLVDGAAAVSVHIFSEQGGFTVSLVRAWAGKNGLDKLAGITPFINLPDL